MGHMLIALEIKMRNILSSISECQIENHGFLGKLRHFLTMGASCYIFLKIGANCFIFNVIHGICFLSIKIDAKGQITVFL